MSVSPEHFAEFLQRMGHTVREVDGLWWYNTNRCVYTSFPFDQDQNAADLRLRDILQRDGVVARFGCPVSQGVSSHRLYCENRKYDFPDLRSRTRTQVRRGLEECRVEAIDFDVLQKTGVSLNADTLIRQGRTVPSNLENYWKRYFATAASTPGAEAWAAFTDRQLAAYLISFVIGTTANILIVRSSTQHLKKFPNNALLFSYLYQRIRDPGIARISYGYESIQAGLGTLDQFKTGMGFQAVPCGQRVEMAGWMRPLLNRYSMASLRRIIGCFGNGESTAKLLGILNWYQQQPAVPAADCDPPTRVAA